MTICGACEQSCTELLAETCHGKRKRSVSHESLRASVFCSCPYLNRLGFRISPEGLPEHAQRRFQIPKDVPILWIDYFEPQSMLPGMRQVAQTRVTAQAVKDPAQRFVSQCRPTSQSCLSRPRPQIRVVREGKSGDHSRPMPV
jgi:hypothetical protein